MMEGTKNGKISQRAKYVKFNTDAPVIIDNKGFNNNTRGLYSDELLPKLEQLASKGLNNKQIAEALCIGERTFYEWRDAYPQFAHSLAKYRGVADILVENALYNAAVGFEYDEQVAIQGFGVLDIKRFQVGNVRAQIFYLKNRMPERYKDKVETVINIPQDISQIAFAIKRREE